MRGRPGVYFTLVNPVDPNLAQRLKAPKHLEDEYDAIFTVDMKRAREQGFEFFQPLNVSVICFCTVPLHNSCSFFWDTAETHTKTKVAVTCAPQSRKARDPPWKRTTFRHASSSGRKGHDGGGNSKPNRSTRVTLDLHSRTEETALSKTTRKSIGTIILSLRCNTHSRSGKTFRHCFVKLRL